MIKGSYRFAISLVLILGGIILVGLFFVLPVHRLRAIGAADRPSEDTVAVAGSPNTTAASCPVTEPPDPPFIAPAPYAPEAPWPGFAWYGDELLWTVVRLDGVWSELPKDEHGYFQKVVWWREGYSWREEPEPALTVTGRRLDGDAPPLESLPATNAYAEDMGSAMMTGVLLPAAGCWEITGRYGTAELSFVVWVEA